MNYAFNMVLQHPRMALNDVPALFNPHINLSPHTCFYRCEDWSTVGGVNNIEGGHSFRMESGHPEPIWGERVIVWSTSRCFPNEPWGTNPANVFAQFRGMFWQVSWYEFLHDWNQTVPGVGHPFGYPGESKIFSEEHPEGVVHSPWKLPKLNFGFSFNDFDFSWKSPFGKRKPKIADKIILN